MSNLSSQHLLRLISDAHPGLIAYVNNKYQFEFASREYIHWFGLRPEELVGKYIWDVVGRENFEARREEIVLAMKGEEVRFSSTSQHLKHGMRDLQQVYKPDIGEDGKVKGIIVVAFDITDQKKSERIARENEARFRSLTENLPHLVWIADADGSLIWFNQKWGEATGTKNEDSYGDGWLKLLHPDDRQPTMDIWQEGMKTNSIKSANYRLKMADGKYRWHMARAFPVLDEKGKLIRWVGTTTDIEEQKEYEAYQSRLLQVMDSSSDFIGMADKNGLGIYMNKGAKRMVGLPEDTPDRTTNILDFFLEEDKEYVKTVILPTTLKEGKWVGEFRFKNFRTGEPIWVHYHSFLTFDEKTGELTGFATVSRDISELKEKERKLKEALSARDHFLSIASHELKTPLTSLKLQSQIMMRNIVHNNQITYDKLLATSNQTNELVDRLSHLIDEMLDVSRIDFGKLRYSKGRYELGNIVREVVSRMSVMFEQAHLEIPKLHFKEELWGNWDRFRLEQVVGNLLTNAIRYGKGKNIEINLERSESDAILSVKDYGLGISPEDQQRIFDRFERAINASEVSGLGLGLFISREIVEAHGGKMWVESELNKGSTFFVCLPLEDKESK